MNDRSKPNPRRDAPNDADREANDPEGLSPTESPAFAGADMLQDAQQCRAELDATRDRLLRTTAEMENVRKRAARELDTERKYADLPLLRELLDVLDNIQRAIEAAEKSGHGGGLLEGFKLVAQQLDTILNRHHCTRIDALGHPFDPHVHEAISQLPSDDYPPGTVMAEAAAGYLLHDRVVRPAQVVVSAAPGPR